MTWRSPSVTFPDIELILCDYLRAAIDDSTMFVSNAVPTARRDRMVIVRRDGGSAVGFRDRPRVSIRCWAPIEQDATDLARLVQSLLPGLIDGAPVVAVATVSAAIPIPDESESFLRLVTAEIHTRGVGA